MYISTITQKGQATIPAEIRKDLDLNPGDKIIFLKDDHQAIVKPAVSLLDLQGSVKSTKKYSDSQADLAILRLKKKEHDQKKART